MRKVYVVIETCGGETTTSVFATEQEAIEEVEERSNQKQDEWDNDNGTSYEGDTNYEAVVWYEEKELKGKGENA